MLDTLFGWLPKLVRALIPIQDTGETDRHFHWRCAMTSGIVGLTLISFFCGLASYGWLSPYYQGFAQAATLDHTDRTLASLLDNTLRESWDHFMTVQCNAETQHNGTMLSIAIRDRQDIEAQWRDGHNQQSYPYGKTCAELIN